MITRLASHMHGLPVPIRNLEDAKNMSRRLSGQATTWLNKGNINRAISRLRPDELVYFMEWAMTCNISDTRSGQSVAGGSNSVIFFTNMRFLCFSPTPENMLEIPLADIYTVAATKGLIFSDIYFRTPALSVEIKTSVANNIDVVREMIIYIAAMATGGGYATAAGVPSSSASAQVCICEGCNATIIIHPGMVNKCEYCGRHVMVGVNQPAANPSFSHATAPQPTSAPLSGSVVTELKMYKELQDAGVLSADEFEAVRKRLLNLP